MIRPLVRSPPRQGSRPEQIEVGPPIVPEHYELAVQERAFCRERGDLSTTPGKSGD